MKKSAPHLAFKIARAKILPKFCYVASLSKNCEVSRVYFDITRGYMHVRQTLHAELSDLKNKGSFVAPKDRYRLVSNIINTMKRNHFKPV